MYHIVFMHSSVSGYEGCFYLLATYTLLLTTLTYK